MVCGVRTKEFFWSNNAPKDTAIEVDTGEGADESIDCLRGADVWNIGEHPVQDEDLGDGRDNCGYHLDGEEGSWWYLHVMAEFQIS